MRVYTAHLRDGRPPVLVREGFSWGALVLGPVWFALRRSWMAALLSLALAVLIALLVTGAAKPWLLLVLVLAQGVVGNDLRRYALARRRFVLAHVLAARDVDGALARLLALRPDLVRVLAE